MNEDKIRKALKDYNANPADRAAQEVLQRQLGVYAVVARQPNGKVDVEETMENLAFALQTGETAQAGCIGVAELLAKPAPKIEADPVDGRPLRKGRTVTEPIVDWSAVPLARRRLVAFAAEVGQLPHSVAPCQSESVAAEVAQATLPPPWPRLEKKLAELEVSAAKGDRAARDAVEAVEARLCFRMKVAAEVRSALVAHATSTSNQTPVPLLVSQSPQRAEVRALIANLCRTDSEFESFVLDYFPDVKRQFGGGMSDTAKVTLLLTSVSAAEVTAALRAAYPRKFPAAAPAATLDLFIVAHTNDARFVDALSRQCFAIKARQTIFDCPAGSNRGDWLRSRLSAARVVVVTLSADMLCDEATMAQIEAAAQTGSRVIPWPVRACGWKSSWLGHLLPLPQDEYEAQQGIARALGR
jgi:hypothetical protein